MPIIFSMIMVLAGLLLWTPDLSFDRLKAFYETPQSQLIQTPESLVFAEDSDPKNELAPAVVLIHGLGSSLQTWDEWVRLLKPQMRVVRFDVPGFGLSSAPSSNDYSDAADLRRLEQFLDHKKLGPFVLVGHALGARMAWTYTAKHPESVTQLVLLSPEGSPSAPSIGPAKESAFVSAPLYDTPFYFGLIRFTCPKWAVKAILENAFADPGLMTEQILSRYHDMLLAPGVRASMLERMSQSMSLDPSASLRSISTPTLILWGEEDRILPLSHLEDFKAAMPSAKTLILKNTGHLIQEESAEDSVKAFLNFLGKGSII
jgi:pimeloyl-ACP methyl ester carboxylesterase